jgi:hypothetical protein
VLFAKVIVKNIYKLVRMLSKISQVLISVINATGLFQSANRLFDKVVGVVCGHVSILSKHRDC